MNRIPKSSPRTFKMEPTGPKVPSRYLTGPTGSCHDHCKCETKHTKETKPMNPSPKRLPRPPTDRTYIEAPNSAPRINRSRSVTPKTTRRNLINNIVVKDQTLKKDVSIEPKKQGKTYNGPSSRTPRRRLSDNFVPNKDMSLPSSRWPKRRLSEIIIHPKTDIASVSNGPTVRGRVNKIESRKDSKLPLVNKKYSSVKPNVSTTKINSKVSPLRTYRSVPKPEVKVPRKTKPVKPIEELVHEETLPINKPNNDVEITKIQDRKSSDLSPSSCKVKAMKDDKKEEVESAPPQMEDDTGAKDGQPVSFELKDMKGYQNEVVEYSPPQMKDDTVEKDCQPLSFEVKAMKDDPKEVVDSLQPQMEENTVAIDGQSSSFEMKAMKDDQNEVVESSSPSKEDDTPKKDDQNGVLESSPTSIEDDNIVKYGQPSSSDVKAIEDDDPSEVLEESSPPPTEDDSLAKDGQQNDNGSDSEFDVTNETTHVEKLVVETDLRFKRGMILSLESENNYLKELQFKKGKELEHETEHGENISLRRLSSDGEVCIAESISINADLKHHETEEKKAAVLNNSIIEEAASKLIQTRKSKVKALVGAFETIVTSETPSYK